ncbi:type II secretion system F family protein [Georgenia muralis]|uniref:Type II secretion system (T2SS) protein F n=1 Tax=Georgenia muralis TaxID=154117 RepID=A0A3N4Z1P0_9MICO|nr:type II secretion system F family protein [Georgenia muralis]RPF27179.1 type II secretion system (T2SS) protein F [Georgenia muralis]
MTDVVVIVLALVAAAPWVLRRRRPGHRRPARAGRGGGAVDVAVLLDLAGAALEAGASVPGTLEALGRALGAAGEVAGSHGTVLRRAGGALRLGAPWDEAWAGVPPALVPLADALEPAWVEGSAPGPLLRHAAASVRAGRHRRAQVAAARMAVRLVLPLGLCFLPAFVLLGVVPVVAAAGGGLLGG